MSAYTRLTATGITPGDFDNFFHQQHIGRCVDQFSVVVGGKIPTGMRYEGIRIVRDGPIFRPADRGDGESDCAMIFEIDAVVPADALAGQIPALQSWLAFRSHRTPQREPNGAWTLIVSDRVVDYPTVKTVCEGGLVKSTTWTHHALAALGVPSIMLTDLANYY